MIESRPIPGRNWEYRFFVDIEGNLDDPDMINAFKGNCRRGEPYENSGKLLKRNTRNTRGKGRLKQAGISMHSPAEGCPFFCKEGVREL